jgi:MFS family permease
MVILSFINFPKRFLKHTILLIIFIFALLYFDGFRVMTSSFEYERDKLLVFFFGFSLFAFILSFFHNENNFEYLVKAIEIVLIIHVVLWVVQTIGLYIANYHIDYLQMLLDKESRAYPKHIAGFVLQRPTGLSNEPGGYAIDTVILLYTSYIIKGRLTKLHIWTILSYFLSFTLFGMIFGFFLIFVHIVIRGIKKIKVYHIFIFSFIIVPMLILSSLYVAFRLEDGNNGSFLMKIQPIIWLYEQDIYRILLGSGFGINDFGGLIADTSIYFNLFFTFGILGILFYFILLFLLRKSFLHKALLTIFFLGKTKLYFMSLWFFLAMLFLTYYKKIGYKK